TDGVLNIYFSSLAVDGGVDNPKVSAIEITNSSNAVPVANAGSSQSINLPTSSATLDGSASSDADGTIASYRWSETSGPNTATFSPNAAAQKPVVSGLVAGTYVFSLVVTDNLGAVSSPSSVTVTVNSVPITFGGGNAIPKISNFIPIVKISKGLLNP
ncbi:MAG: PKD domain-containing protein, partial [Segetibacter sp.]